MSAVAKRDPSTVANVALTGYQAIQVVFFVQVVGVAPAAVGFLVAASGVGGVLGAALATWLARKWGTARSLLVSLLTMAPLGFLIPLATSGPCLGPVSKLSPAGELGLACR
jgi:predicted MFS family arabinose efflux permease